MSLQKEQISLRKVKYLGRFNIGSLGFGSRMKESYISNKISPKKQLRTFLGMAGLCRIGTNLGIIAKPLYEATKGPDTKSLLCNGSCEVAFNALKERLGTAPALGLPNLEKPFTL